jgi:hypothetical protein
MLGFRHWSITEAERACQPDSIGAKVVGREEEQKSTTLSAYSGGPSISRGEPVWKLYPLALRAAFGWAGLFVAHLRSSLFPA